MTKRRIAQAAAARVAAAGVMLVAAVGPARAAQLLLVSDPYCPFVCDLAAGQGASVDMAREALRLAGLDTEFRILPFKRAMDDTKSGAADGIVAVAEAPDRPFVWPREAVGRKVNFFFRRKGEIWVYYNLASLDTVRIGAVGGYVFSPELSRYFKANRAGNVEMIAATNALELNLKKLMAGRLDVIVDDVDVVRFALKTRRLADQVEPVSPAGPEVPLWVGFSPAQPGAKVWAEKLSWGIDTLRKSGRLATILNGYGLTDWKTAE